VSVVVFCGPTIAAAEVRRELEASIRPPAQRGDVLGAALGEPDAIVLIDGYFDRVPSVWHKEILWAMAQGIHVFGASSMGALRAAELAAFGMVGVGEIFEAFQRGELEDDDEVTVAHGDLDSRYRPASEAMVNIRWTLRAAERSGILSAATRLELEKRAKQLPYDQRALQLVLKTLDPGSVAASELSQLRDWLPKGRVDQKRADALSAIRQVAALEQAGWRRKRVDYHLAETDGWSTLHAQVEAALGRRSDCPLDARIEHELRARGLLGRALTGATLRLLAEERLRDRRVHLNPRAVEALIDEFRRNRELFSEASFDAWLEHAGLEGEALESFFCREAGAAATRAELRGRLALAVEDELRASGQLRELSSAAVERAALLERHGLSAPTLEDAGVTEGELWSWFFAECVRIALPSSIPAYAAGEGSSVEQLRTSALRSLVCARLINGAQRS
jgi:hypothetical protein